MTVSSGSEQRFGAYLRELVDREDRAALAALRRALGKPPGLAAEAHRYVVPWLHDPPDERRDAAYYLVAALFALHQGSWRDPSERAEDSNLGASMRLLANSLERESVERRFTVLLNSHVEEFPRHLRHAVALLKTKEIGIDWARLLQDVQRWGREDRRVQRLWARAFWGHRREEAASESGSSASDDGEAAA